MSEKIIVELTREQAQAVMDATELLARLEIGQFDEVSWKLLHHFEGKDRDGKRTFDGHSRDLADAYLKCACFATFGVKNGWPDIGDKTIQHKRCWTVYSAIRHALAWHDHPEGGITVNFNKPMGYGEPIPNVEIKEDV